MSRRRFAPWLAAIISMTSGSYLMQDGCGGYGYDAYYSDDCIGPDGYNWCLPGSWSGTDIHEPTVTPWDFTDW